MGGITWKQQQRLVEIGRVAYGSGITEGSNGGRGYMGVFNDIGHASGGSYTKRVVKFLTHKGETLTIDGKPLSERDMHDISLMTSSLRKELYMIAENLRDTGVRERIRDLLQVDEDGESLEDAPLLISRKVVAKVITEIANATQAAMDRDEDDFEGEYFSWDMVKEAGRAETVGDTSIDSLFDYLENMWIDELPSDQRRRLFDIASMAYGSGVREGSRGGRGYVALARDEEGNDLPVKFLTHSGETTDDLTPEQWAQLDRMTNDLRIALLDIAENAGEKTEEKVRALLKVDKFWAPTADAPRLLTRKVVAEVVSVIMKVDRGQDGLGEETFSWRDVAARSKTVADTSVNAVLSRVDLRKQLPPRIGEIKAKVDEMRGHELTKVKVWDYLHALDRYCGELLKMVHLINHSVGEYPLEDLKKLGDDLLVVLRDAEKLRNRVLDELKRRICPDASKGSPSVRFEVK